MSRLFAVGRLALRMRCDAMRTFAAGEADNGDHLHLALLLLLSFAFVFALYRSLDGLLRRNGYAVLDRKAGNERWQGECPRIGGAA